MARVDQIYQDLNHYNYYELLNLQPDAVPDDIRAAYHRMAVSLHPDRFHSAGDVQLKGKVSAIYKRIAEGYRVLMNDALRPEYNRGLGAGHLRLVKAERPKVGPKRPENAIDNPQARKFFLLGKDAEHRGDKKGARMNYKFALDMVGDHPLILERLRACEQE